MFCTRRNIELYSVKRLINDILKHAPKIKC